MKVIYETGNILETFLINNIPMVRRNLCYKEKSWKIKIYKAGER